MKNDEQIEVLLEAGKKATGGIWRNIWKECNLSKEDGAFVEAAANSRQAIQDLYDEVLALRWSNRETQYTHTETLIKELEGMRVFDQTGSDVESFQSLMNASHNAAIDAVIERVKNER